MGYVILAVIVVLLSAKLFKKGCGTISLYRPNMMSIIFYYYLVLQCVIGAVLVVTNVDNHYLINKLSYEKSRILGYAAVIYTCLVLPIGMIVANKVWGIKNISVLLKKYCNKQIAYEYKYDDKIVKAIIVFLSIVCCISVIYVFLIIKEISLLKMFSGASAIDLAGFRQNVGRNFPGNEYIKNILALGLTPTLSYVAYAYKLRNNTNFNRWWFWITFMCSIQILSYDLEKSPVLVYLIGFIFFRIYLDKPLKKKHLTYLFSGVLIIVVIMYMLLLESGLDLKTLFAFNSGIVGRLTLTSIAGLFFNFDLWPSNYDYLGFSSFSSVISNMFGLPESERASRLVMEALNPSSVKAGTAGVVNSLFIGEAYANWGYLGAVFSPLWVGFVIQSLYLFFLKSPKTPLILALFVSFSFKSSITGGINDYIYNVGTIFIIVVVISIYLASKKLKRRIL